MPEPPPASADAHTPPDDPPRSTGFAAGFRVVSGLTLLSRFSGLARDAMCSRLFGAGAVWSAFAFAFLIPNLFRRLFGEGALAAAFLPTYAQTLKRDPALADRFASAALAILLAGLGLFTILGEGLILVLLTATPLGETGGLALRLTMIMLPYMPMVCATALLGGVLQCRDRFGPPAAAPIVLNLAIIAAAGSAFFIFRDDLRRAIFTIAWAVLAAGVLQLVWSLLALRGLVRWTRLFAGAGPAVRRTLVNMTPVLLGMGALQINTLLDGLIASWPVIVGPTLPLPSSLGGGVDYPLDGASNAVLFFAQRLYQFPLGVFGIALATAVFPALSRQADEPARFVETLRRGLRLSLFIALPASVGLIAVRHSLTFTLFGGGRFGDEETARVANVLLGYAPAVAAYSITHVLTRSFYARGETTTPTRVALIAIACNLALNLTLIWPLREAALAWSTSICGLGQAGALLAVARRRSSEPIFDGPARRGFARSIALTIVMAMALTALATMLPPPDTYRAHLTALAAMVGAGAAVYLAVALLTRAAELRWLVRRDEPEA